MQDRTATRTSRAVAVALYAQSATRRGAAASAEGQAGLLMLHEGRLEALRREHQRMLRRRQAEQQLEHLETVKSTYASYAMAA